MASLRVYIRVVIGYNRLGQKTVNICVVSARNWGKVEWLNNSLKILSLQETD